MKVRARYEGTCECAHQVISIETTEENLTLVAEAWQGECVLCGAAMIFTRTKVRRLRDNGEPCLTN